MTSTKTFRYIHYNKYPPDLSPFSHVICVLTPFGTTLIAVNLRRHCQTFAHVSSMFLTNHIEALSRLLYRQLIINNRFYRHNTKHIKNRGFMRRNFIEDMF